jgi:hypothetical protein
MNVMIYIPDDLVGEIRDAAKASGKSLSAYLYGLHRAVGSPLKIPKSFRVPEGKSPGGFFNPMPKGKKR